ncbi:nucleoside triphosphate pyrophosphohydrolase [Caldibacillus lycopersici]|uniref:Nucleoside triphosphate pyrophosphohydrolase n=1 Tax=Perspicuibacillus lycopersici TaxID=1325689 RepID=A0AAE3LPT1_9BACI|nr:nucleoside triphosphate pyrophosphohydrolase [Perspicuibacillus lycopersici]MCU9615281.1 nucleoside triphosphate pyrophosphohydrolase [Perspicuibacillus lycopersici]
MKKITVVGLGAGDINQLPLGVYRLLNENYPLYLRTREHPVIAELEKEGLTYQSFDSIYEAHEQFESVYTEIVEALLLAAEKGPIVYAVPGHPLVAERTVQLLMEEGKDNQYEIILAGGQSFLDALFQSVRMDPIDGFQLLDGTNFHKGDIRLTQHMIIGQVYDAMSASNVKLELMDLLPDDYEVYIVTNAGNAQETVKKVPLYLLDHDWDINNLTSIYVPPVKQVELLYKDFQNFRQIIATLRGPNGCPWDIKQTHRSLKKYLLEEAYELLEAIDEEDDDHIVEELGDVLLQIMLHAQIGEDNGYFSIEDVIESIASKMVRRHPHVFGEVVVNDADEVVANWQKIKEQEPGRETPSVLAKVGKGLPALMQAYEIQKAAGKVGFDWQEIEPVLTKVKEEIQELLVEIKADQKANILLELGDVLFGIVNVARKLHIHPEEALLATNQKFTRRFEYIEKKVKESGKDFTMFTLEELDQYWEEAKKLGL